jgi:hypothetical protein
MSGSLVQDGIYTHAFVTPPTYDVELDRKKPALQL